MSARDTSGAAFPSHGSMGEVVQDGMTLRDYFAAKAMYAFCREDTCFVHLPDTEHEENIAIAAYAQADAMLKARQK